MPEAATPPPLPAPHPPPPIFHIAQNQPFTDGNKRTAITCALTFLDLNGIDPSR
ncbi:MAG: Fic family protein, partial [Burkholderiales bacterium]|nr:Fic family protein [Opitutaceae bacterium]